MPLSLGLGLGFIVPARCLLHRSFGLELFVPSLFGGIPGCTPPPRERFPMRRLALMEVVGSGCFGVACCISRTVHEQLSLLRGTEAWREDSPTNNGSAIGSSGGLDKTRWLYRVGKGGQEESGFRSDIVAQYQTMVGGLM
jgi:hypothetical protein